MATSKNVGTLRQRPGVGINNVLALALQTSSSCAALCCLPVCFCSYCFRFNFHLTWCSFFPCITFSCCTFSLFDFYFINQTFPCFKILYFLTHTNLPSLDLLYFQQLRYNNSTFNRSISSTSTKSTSTFINHV